MSCGRVSVCGVGAPVGTAFADAIVIVVPVGALLVGSWRVPEYPPEAGRASAPPAIVTFKGAGPVGAGNGGVTGAPPPPHPPRRAIAP